MDSWFLRNTFVTPNFRPISANLDTPSSRDFGHGNFTVVGNPFLDAVKKADVGGSNSITSTVQFVNGKHTNVHHHVSRWRKTAGMGFNGGRVSPHLVLGELNQNHN